MKNSQFGNTGPIPIQGNNPFENVPSINPNIIKD